MKKIAITTTTFAQYDQAPLALCAESGYEVILNPYKRKIKADELVALACNAEGLVAGTEMISGDTMSRLPDLRVISRCGVGTDNVDLGAAKKQGIKVFNTPSGPTQAVAELAIALILNLLRRVNEMNRDIRADKWNKLMGNLLCGKKVGIVGMGRIGSKVADLLSPFGVEIAFYDQQIKSASASARRIETLDELLSWADIVTIHISFSSKENYIIGKSELALMRRGSWLVNLSRGGVVDEEALYESLRQGRLAGAAVDVFKEEPYQGFLRELNNVILTPHAGSYAQEARINMEIEAVKNVLRGLSQEE